MMSENYTQDQKTIARMLVAMDHMQSANLAASEVLLGVLEKLLASNQVFTRQEAEAIVKSCREINHSHGQARRLIHTALERGGYEEIIDAASDGQS